MTEKILRRVFPLVSTCPECDGKEYRRCGSSRSGDIQYRICKGCRGTYRVLPIGLELDRDGMVSEIRPW